MERHPLKRDNYPSAKLQKNLNLRQILGQNILANHYPSRMLFSNLEIRKSYITDY